MLGVLDRRGAGADQVVGHPVLGSDDELAAVAVSTRATACVAAIGENLSRHLVLTREIASCSNLIHPSVVVARDVVMGPGSIVMRCCRIWLPHRHRRAPGTCASLDHDCTMGDFSSPAPGATAGEHVHLRNRTALELGASVIHGVTIGAHTVVGAGALVVDDFAERVVAYGVPARVARTREINEPYFDRSPRTGSA